MKRIAQIGTATGRHMVVTYNFKYRPITLRFTGGRDLRARLDGDEESRILQASHEAFNVAARRYSKTWKVQDGGIEYRIQIQIQKVR